MEWNAFKATFIEIKQQNMFLVLAMKIIHLIVCDNSKISWKLQKIN